MSWVIKDECNECGEKETQDTKIQYLEGAGIFQIVNNLNTNSNNSKLRWSSNCILQNGFEM